MALRANPDAESLPQVLEDRGLPILVRRLLAVLHEAVDGFEAGALGTTEPRPLQLAGPEPAVHRLL
jgi:hypothetical protein